MSDALRTTESSLLDKVLQALANCADLQHRQFPHQYVGLLYFDHLVGKEQLRKDVLEPFGATGSTPTSIGEQLGQSQYKQAVSADSLVRGVLEGQVAIFHAERAYLYDAYAPDSRSISGSETETVISGPQDSFTESLGTNLSLIRRRLKDSRLKAVSMTIGSKSATRMALLYLDGVADPDDVRQLQGKINAIQTDTILDANSLIQYLTPSMFDLLPQCLTSVRPDVMVSKLADGKIIGLVDGSQAGFSTPASFYEFFSSTDDYYQSWVVASATRLLRFLALFITLGFTALYVTIVTYHYEMIPPSLLNNLMESRNKVPFTPLMEAIIMEFTIELLREAGARLPTKIGTTIGTVGGIVIGQAAVQAGITSNILIISVSVSAIASFAIPSYAMSSSIRIFRFSIILLAGMLGNFGLVLGFAYVCIQLSGSSLFGGAYMAPQIWGDMFLRLPMAVMDKAKRRAAKKSESTLR